MNIPSTWEVSCLRPYNCNLYKVWCQHVWFLLKIKLWLSPAFIQLLLVSVLAVHSLQLDLGWYPIHSVSRLATSLQALEVKDQ